MTRQRPNFRLRMMLWAYAMLWYALLPFVLLYLWRRGRSDAEYGRHVSERFGRYALWPPGAVWIHAVSLGEMRSAVPLVRALLAQGERVVCTHFTPAGRSEALRVFAAEIAQGRLRSHWVPFEFGWAYRRFFRAFRPKIGLVMEIEIWPGMIFAAQRAQIPLWMCNAQYPNRSMARDARGWGFRHGCMQGFAGALVKSDLQATRFASVGVRNIHVTGELRFDQPIPPHLITQANRHRQTLPSDRPIIAISSAIEGEDSLYISMMHRVLQAFTEEGQVRPLFVYVPRKPERFDVVGDMITLSGLSMAKRSAVFDDTLTPKATLLETDALLGDSLGEMYFYLQLADRVVTGGGFHPNGAHNISEALSLHRPVLVGPHTHTIEYPATEAMSAGVCLCVETEDALVAALSPNGWKGPQEHDIRDFLQEHSGGTKRTLAVINQVIEGPGPS